MPLTNPYNVLRISSSLHVTWHIEHLSGNTQPPIVIGKVVKTLNKWINIYASEGSQSTKITTLKAHNLALIK